MCVPEILSLKIGYQFYIVTLRTYVLTQQIHISSEQYNNTMSIQLTCLYDKHINYH